MIAGIDEAGRGPVLGPLVVAAVAAPSQTRLRRLGVKDSKLLTPARREALVAGIQDICTRVEVRVVDVAELDAGMTTRTLNDIEADAFAELLARLRPDEAILDACDVDAARFGRLVSTRAGVAGAVTLQANDGAAVRARHATCTFADGRACKVRSQHQADADHPIVAAASIVAKVERDRQMRLLSDKHGAVGSGYSHDPVTRAFLAAWFETHGTLPPFARRHWETSRRLVPTHRSLETFGTPE